MASGEFRLRVCYRKIGPVRFLSHLEVMRALERAARRARMPYAVSHGFNPRMKAAFGPALPVGTAGEREYFDLWLTAYVPAAEALGRLQAVTPDGLAPVEAKYVHQKEPSLTAAATLAVYRVSVTGEEVDAPSVEGALSSVIGEGSLKREHKGKTKLYDLERSLPKGARVGSDGPVVTVDVTVRMGQEGSLRPEVLLGEALSRIGCVGAEVKVTRADLLIEEENGTRRPI